jgi:nicotinate-nucleotide adenylyltransferase
MKVGLLGGTFDPVHNGHLALASAAYAGLGLDVVLFLPAGQPWRKGDRTITPAAHRLAMLRLAVEGDPRFGVTDVELRRDGPTFTADTIEALAGERLDDELYFILGADALADLPNWHEPERIVRHAVLAVAPRAGEPPDPAVLAAAGIDAARVRTFAMAPVAASSSDVRRRAAAGHPIDALVPPAVAAYIAEHALYGP